MSFRRKSSPCLFLKQDFYHATASEQADPSGVNRPPYTSGVNLPASSCWTVA